MLEKILQDTIEKLKDAIAKVAVSQAQASSTIEEYSAKIKDLKSREEGVKKKELAVSAREEKVSAIEDVVVAQDKLVNAQRLFAAEMEEKKRLASEAADKVLEDRGILNTREQNLNQRQTDLDEKEKTYKTEIEKEILGSAIKKIQNS